MATAASLEAIATLEQPVSVSADPVDGSRLFVAERHGAVVEVNATGTDVFADFATLVSCCLNERGLNSIALAPDFASSGRFYAAYAGTVAAGGEEGDLHIDSFRPDPGNGLIREPILEIDHDQHSDHYGGQLQFGPDGYLYISVGDGAGGGDPLGSGQGTGTLLGKILRIDPRPGEDPPYLAPTGNPFLAGSGLDEIWSYGLRNPWRFSFDRLNGDLMIGDVGQGLREEIDYAPSPGPGVVGGDGANYGWSCREGLVAFPGAAAECASATGFVDPVFDYTHTAPSGAHRCAVIGGYVSRDPDLDDLYGRYVYGDLCSGEIRSLVLPDGSGMATDDRWEGLTVDALVSFGEDALGRLYAASGDGPVYRLVATAPSAPSGDGAGAAGPAASAKTARLRLRLRSEVVGEHGVRLVVRLTPCAGHGGVVVQLNKGGNRLSLERLDRKCVTRFFDRVALRVATFRALLRGDPSVRSPRLVVELPRPR